MHSISVPVAEVPGTIWYGHYSPRIGVRTIAGTQSLTSCQIRPPASRQADCLYACLVAQHQVQQVGQLVCVHLRWLLVSVPRVDAQEVAPVPGQPEPRHQKASLQDSHECELAAAAAAALAHHQPCCPPQHEELRLSCHSCRLQRRCKGGKWCPSQHVQGGRDY